MDDEWYTTAELHLLYDEPETGWQKNPPQLHQGKAQDKPINEFSNNE